MFVSTTRESIVMKNIIVCVIASLLILFSVTASSERILITGKPAALELHEGYFALPKTYTARMGYYFVTVMNTERVCYLVKKPELAKLDLVQYVLDVDGEKFPWNFYNYDPIFFEIDF